MSLRLALRGLLACLSIIVPVAAAPAAEVGFQQSHMADGTEIGVWYPAAGTAQRQRVGLYEQEVVPDAAPVGERLALVVMSHGTGGHFAGHFDTAIALARAGFIVAALTHPGDNWQDNSGATQIERRPRALSALITYMLESWPSHASIDPQRIGAFGFSAGGFTVLAAAGGRPDLTRLAGHCADHPGFFDCALLKDKPPGPIQAWPDVRDPRIKAIVVAAPALGFTFGKDGLSAVSVPVQLWRAGDDRILPAPFYADAVKTALPRPPEFQDVPGAGHFDFLAPCGNEKTVPQICTSNPGFDRAAFHIHFDREVLRFFAHYLGQ
jgi:predicted dienelactone hydrolase